MVLNISLEPPNKRMKDDTDSNDGMAGPSGSQNNQIPPPFGMNRMPMPPGNNNSVL